MTPSKEPSAKRLDIVADEVRSRSSDFLLAFRAGEYVPGDYSGNLIGHVCTRGRPGLIDDAALLLAFIASLWLERNIAQLERELKDDA